MTVFINDSVRAEGGFLIYAGIFPRFPGPGLLRKACTEPPGDRCRSRGMCCWEKMHREDQQGWVGVFLVFFFWSFCVGFSPAGSGGFKFTVTTISVGPRTRYILEQQNSLTRKLALFVLMKLKIHELDSLNESERKINR